MSFHPFQGRPLFGRDPNAGFYVVEYDGVSIPFREDLYSDLRLEQSYVQNKLTSFHPFQGRPLFGHKRFFGGDVNPAVQVSIPFREDLYSDINQWSKLA